MSKTGDRKERLRKSIQGKETNVTVRQESTTDDIGNLGNLISSINKN